MQGEKLENSSAEATALMWRIPDIQDIRGRFFSKSKNSEHITKLVQEQRQKPPMQRRASCYFDRDRVNEDGSHTRNSLNWSASRNRSPLKSWGGDRNRSKSSVRPSTSTSSRWSNNSSAERSRAASPPPSTRYNSYVYYLTTQCVRSECICTRMTVILTFDIAGGHKMTRNRCSVY